MHFDTTSWNQHSLKMAQCYLQWSNQGMIILSMYVSRTIHIYWWLSDYYYIEKNDIVALWWTWRIIVLRQAVASLLSLCMTKWLRKWWQGWHYVHSNVKTAKYLLALFSQSDNTCKWETHLGKQNTTFKLPLPAKGNYLGSWQGTSD